MNNKFREKSGLTLVELLIAVVICVMLLGGILTAYMYIHRYWKSGEKQFKIQGQGMLVLKRMSQKIMVANQVNPESGDSNSIVLEIPDDLDKYRFWYDSGNQNISYDKNTPADSEDDMVLANQVIIKAGKYLFNVNGKIVTINFKLKDPISSDGYQGFDVHTKVYLRNK